MGVFHEVKLTPHITLYYYYTIFNYIAGLKCTYRVHEEGYRSRVFKIHLRLQEYKLSEFNLIKLLNKGGHIFN